MFNSFALAQHHFFYCGWLEINFDCFLQKIHKDEFSVLITLNRLHLGHLLRVFCGILG